MMMSLRLGVGSARVPIKFGWSKLGRVRAALGAGCLASLGCGGGGDDGQSIPFALDEESSAYAELVEGLDDMDANDGNDHLDQRAISRWAAAGITDEQLAFLFDHGDELTELEFTSADGIGALNTSARFARHPTRNRFTGPNARSCGACHDQPLGNGAGRNVANVVQDPQPDVEGEFNIRNTRNINGDAWLQLAGIEMTMDLQAQRDQLHSTVLMSGLSDSVALSSKGISFGTLSCGPGEAAGSIACDYSRVEGVSADLVVRSQGWKGNFTTVRSFAEDAFFGEMGIHSDRLAHHVQSPGLAVPDDVHLSPPDVDQDGVINEMSVGDITAMAVYLAAQAPPTTLVELADEGKLKLSAEDRARIEAGRDAFGATGCSDCHALELRVESSIFLEPDARVTSYYDFLLANTNNGYDFASPVALDLAESSIVERHLAPQSDEAGEYFAVPAMTDLKRHYLGDHLCDDAKVYLPVNAAYVNVAAPADSAGGVEMGIDRCEFLTADLWGIGGTAPYLHDGRAATLAEAIALHCAPIGAPQGEAEASCRSFLALPQRDQASLVAFLRNQVMEPEP